MADGYHIFKWNGGGETVTVTGSFDNWKETQKMSKGEDGNFTVSVDLEKKDKVLYKFVVDGQWTTDSAQRIETDSSGNTNNYLLPEDIREKTVQAPFIPADAPDQAVEPFIHSAGPTSTTAALAAAVPLESAKKEEKSAPVDIPDTPAADEPAEAESAAPDAVAAILSSAAPESTTAALAGEVPLEKKADETSADSGAAILSSAAPESTTAALAAKVPLETKADETPAVASAIPSHIAGAETGVTPGNDDVPGGFPETPAVEQTEDQTVKVSPLPASQTPGNPIKLEPGEPIPPSTADVTDNVKLDEESYNKPDASNLGVGAAATAGLAAVTGAVSSAYHTVVGDTPKEGDGPAEATKEGTAGDNEIHVPEAVKNLIPESALPMTIPGVGVIPATESSEEAAKEAEAAKPADAVIPEAPKDVETPKAVEPIQGATGDVVELKKEDVPAAALPSDTLPLVPETTPIATVPADAVVDTPAQKTETEATAPKVLPLIEADTEEQNKPAGPTEPVADKPADKPAEPSTTAAAAASDAPADLTAAPAPVAPAATESPEASASTPSAPATENKDENGSSQEKKKKKNRLSMLFSKLTGKDKHKESK